MCSRLRIRWRKVKLSTNQEGDRQVGGERVSGERVVSYFFRLPRAHGATVLVENELVRCACAITGRRSNCFLARWDE
jgi:hypothetical protein